MRRHLQHHGARGFSLVELMITLLLGAIITGAVIQVLVSSQVTNKLNQAIAQVQESGRFIMTRLSRELLEVGRYDNVAAQIDGSVDTVSEAAYVVNHPVVLIGDMATSLTLGSTQAGSGGNDSLVVSMLASEDCTGNRHGYAAGDEFHVVNRYFVSDSELKCTGYDGRVLRGLKVAGVAPSTVTLLDNVESFQVQYGVTSDIDTSNGQAVRYVTADELGVLRANNQQVVALRWGVLIKSYESQLQTTSPRFAVLNEAPVTLDNLHYYQVFTKTLALRNMKNFVRSSQ
ncbi:PilW family protein [Alteromonas sp. CYL-A6]|uniref:PilW family protein n=1 Tax=Alteromonas nitratireducens TaxID=3390813 RepID=UPI0034BDACAD